jgi:hypothetical protein
MLDDLGLGTPCPGTPRLGRRSGIAVNLDVPRELGRLPDEVELCLYRIVQALTRVHHHSGSPGQHHPLRPRVRDGEIADQAAGSAKASAGPMARRPSWGRHPGHARRVRQLERVRHPGDEGGTVVRVVLPPCRRPRHEAGAHAAV